MSVDKKILEEISKYNNINKYISEQETDLPEPIEGGGEDVELDGSELDIDDVQPVDVESDPEVEVVGEPTSELSGEESGTEELDITDLVTTQKDMSTKQEEYMDSMMDRLNDLTSKLSDMDKILVKINNLEDKVDKYRQKSPEEKLQLTKLAWETKGARSVRNDIKINTFNNCIVISLFKSHIKIRILIIFQDQCFFFFCIIIYLYSRTLNCIYHFLF